MRKTRVIEVSLFMVLVCAGTMVQAQRKIGVNLNGDAADANGNQGLYPQGPASLAPTDFVFGQDHWNNIANNLGWRGDEGPNTQPISDNLGSPCERRFEMTLLPPVRKVRFLLCAP